MCPHWSMYQHSKKLILVCLFCVQVADCPPGNKPEFAVIGRSNVGKSSLVNLLCGNQLAKVSKVPGAD